MVTCVYMLALCVFESDGGGGIVQATGSQTVCQDKGRVWGGQIKGHMEKEENGGMKWREEPLMKKRW